jgi:hypothetical protein
MRVEIALQCEDTDFHGDAIRYSLFAIRFSLSRPTNQITYNPYFRCCA